LKYRRSCKKCDNYDETMTEDDVAVWGPPDPCTTCKRFYPDNFEEKED